MSQVYTEVKDIAEAQNDTKYFDPHLEAADNELIQKVHALLTKENEFFEQFKIHKRKDGSYYAILAAEANDEDLETAIHDTSWSLMKNKGELVKYFEMNLETLKNKRIPIVRYFNDDNKIQINSDQHFNVPSELIVGYMTSFRIKNTGKRKELHTEFKPNKNTFKETDLDFRVTSGQMTTGLQRRLWTADQVDSIIFFYFDVLFTPKGYIEAYEPDFYLKSLNNKLKDM